jgi:hypothetical protein
MEIKANASLHDSLPDISKGHSELCFGLNIFIILDNAKVRQRFCARTMAIRRD